MRGRYFVSFCISSSETGNSWRKFNKDGDNRREDKSLRRRRLLFFIQNFPAKKFLESCEFRSFHVFCRFLAISAKYLSARMNETLWSQKIAQHFVSFSISDQNWSNIELTCELSSRLLKECWTLFCKDGPTPATSFVYFCLFVQI